MSRDKNTRLIEGSHYLVKSLSSRDEILKTKGYFEGYTQLGNNQAIILKLDDSHEYAGEKRIIPCHVIASIDVIDQVEPEEEEQKETSSYFG